VSVVSDRDLVEYPRLAPGARLCLVPNGVDFPPGPSAGSADGPLLFVGAMHYPPNASAVRWLVQELLPELPGAQLLVVGEGVVPDHPRVRATGYVESLDEVWRGASALVVPLRAGGGTRLKVLEAMAHGVPVLSTALGVEGLGAVPGEHYLEAETVEDFAEAARRLATDVALRARLCAAGRSLAERYEWSRCVAPLLSMVRSL
jgi:glycosyltransferase involved in cell wall biosynthesis